MAKTKTLSPVIAGAATVSSLSDSDYVLIKESGGRLKASAPNRLMEFGGRNYLRTNILSYAPACSISDGKLALAEGDSYARLSIARDLTHLIGRKLTFSCLCEGLNEESSVIMGIGSQSKNLMKLKNGRNSITFIGDSTTCPAKGGWILIDDASKKLIDIQASDIKLSEFKLEQGEVATDWSIAPEELLENAKLAVGGGKSLVDSKLQIFSEDGYLIRVSRKGVVELNGENQSDHQRLSEKHNAGCAGTSWECLEYRCGHSNRYPYDQLRFSRDISHEDGKLCQIRESRRATSKKRQPLSNLDWRKRGHGKPVQVQRSLATVVRTRILADRKEVVC